MISLATIAMVAESKITTEEEPKTFDKAWNHPDMKLQRRWQEAIQKEFANLTKQQV